MENQPDLNLNRNSSFPPLKGEGGDQKEPSKSPRKGNLKGMPVTPVDSGEADQVEHRHEVETRGKEHFKDVEHDTSGSLTQHVIEQKKPPSSVSRTPEERTTGSSVDGEHRSSASPENLEINSEVFKASEQSLEEDTWRSVSSDESSSSPSPVECLYAEVKEEAFEYDQRKEELIKKLGTITDALEERATVRNALKNELATRGKISPADIKDVERSIELHEAYINGLKESKGVIANKLEQLAEESAAVQIMKEYLASLVQQQKNFEVARPLFLKQIELLERQINQIKTNKNELQAEIQKLQEEIKKIELTIATNLTPQQDVLDSTIKEKQAALEELLTSRAESQERDKHWEMIEVGKEPQEEVITSSQNSQEENKELPLQEEQIAAEVARLRRELDELAQDRYELLKHQLFSQQAALSLKINALTAQSAIHEKTISEKEASQKSLHQEIQILEEKEVLLNFITTHSVPFLPAEEKALHEAALPTSRTLLDWQTHLDHPFAVDTKTAQEIFYPGSFLGFLVAKNYGNRVAERLLAEANEKISSETDTGMISLLEVRELLNNNRVEYSTEFTNQYDIMMEGYVEIPKDGFFEAGDYLLKRSTVYFMPDIVKNMKPNAKQLKLDFPRCTKFSLIEGDHSEDIRSQFQEKGQSEDSSQLDAVMIKIQRFLGEEDPLYLDAASAIVNQTLGSIIEGISSGEQLDYRSANRGKLWMPPMIIDKKLHYELEKKSLGSFRVTFTVPEGKLKTIRFRENDSRGINYAFDPAIGTLNGSVTVDFSKNLSFEKELPISEQNFPYQVQVSALKTDYQLNPSAASETK